MCWDIMSYALDFVAYDWVMCYRYELDYVLEMFQLFYIDSLYTIRFFTSYFNGFIYIFVSYD